MLWELLDIVRNQVTFSDLFLREDYIGAFKSQALPKLNLFVIFCILPVAPEGVGLKLHKVSLDYLSSWGSIVE